MHVYRESDGASKELVHPGDFSGNGYTTLLMSNGYDKVFMYTNGILFEFSEGYIKDYSPLKLMSSKDFCNQITCKLKFDKDGTMYFYFENSYKHIWIRIPYKSIN